MVKTKGAQAPTTTLSDRFTGMVVREYSSEISSVKLTEFQKKMAQHLFVRVDMALKELEKKRVYKNQTNKAPFVWKNVNMQKLAVDAVHRIELGLDALIPNHIHTVPYFNSKAGLYDLDLRVGYAGKDYYYREMALHPIIDIVYELVHESDEFTVIKKQINQGVESYEFKITDPFNRGPVIGGFGYVAYEDERRNRVVVLTMADFKASRGAAMSNEFWSKHTEAMQYKTIVHRTVSRIVLDPRKINKSFAQVEYDEVSDPDEREQIAFNSEVEAEANKGDIIDVEPVVDVFEDPAEEEPPQKEDKPAPGNEAGPGF